MADKSETVENPETRAFRQSCLKYQSKNFFTGGIEQII